MIHAVNDGNLVLVRVGVGLLGGLAREANAVPERLAMLFISHDLAVMEYLSDRIAVVYLGRLMEIGPSRELVSKPRHPYTEALISAVPDPTGARKRIILQGDAPNPVSPPSGCVFHTRCPYALPVCATDVPPLREVAARHWKACHRDDVPATS